jgi:RNA polymerase sigma-70 factor, ECF subfamily
MKQSVSNTVLLETLYFRLQKRLIRYLTNLLHDQDRAEELAQEVFLRAWCADLNQIRSDAWMFRVARNLAIDSIRRDRHSVSFVPLDDDLVEVTSTLMKDEIHDRIHATLARLSYRERQLLVAHYIQGYSLAIIAQYHGTPIGTIQSRISRARDAFRRGYQAEAEQSESGVTDRSREIDDRLG